MSYVGAVVLPVKERGHVAMAKVAGSFTILVLVGHMLPGVLNTVIGVSISRLEQFIFTEATLSFIGAGNPAPMPAWGFVDLRRAKRWYEKSGR